MSACENRMWHGTDCTSPFSFLILDIKECSLPSSCHKDATCKELEGSYNCSCKEGYTGNGTHCEGMFVKSKFSL